MPTSTPPRRPLRGLPLLLLALTSPLAAQELRPVTCRLLWFDHAPPPALVHVGEKQLEIRCPLDGHVISPPVRLTANRGTITFLHEETRKPAATVTVPAATKSAILVVVPTAEAAADIPPAARPLRIFLIDDSPAKFPDGGAFVANFYRQDIRFVIGEQRNLLRPGGSHGFTRPQQRDPFNMAPVVVQFQQDDAWRTASESTVRFIPGSRHLIVAYVDPASGRPRIATFCDIKPPPEPPPA